MTVKELIEQAIAMEKEGADKYEEWSDVANKEGDTGMSGLFKELASVKRLHAEIMEGKDGGGGGCGSNDSSGEDSGGGCGGCSSEGSCGM